MTSVTKRRHTGTQIAATLRQADVLIGQGKTIPEVCKEIEVSEHTYCRWCQKYGQTYLVWRSGRAAMNSDKGNNPKRLDTPDPDPTGMSPGSGIRPGSQIGQFQDDLRISL